MKKTKLSNGIKVIFNKRQSDSIVILISVDVGSNNEELRINGISHFLEHMMFEGTKTRDAKKIANTIERIGGELNAYTSNERTVYYIKVLNKHFKIALEIISDMIQNSTFNDIALNKERGVILEEVNMVNDEPRHYQWIMLEKAMMPAPLSNPTYGTVKAVKTITRQDMIDYYEKHYVGENMIVAVSGNIKDPTQAIKKKFSNINKGKKSTIKIEKNPDPKAKLIETRQINQSYMAIGFKTIERKHNDSIILDVIQAHLGRGQSGKLFEEVRIKRGLAYDVGAYHSTGKDQNFFVINTGTNKENLNTIRKIIYDEIRNLQNLSQEELKDAKSYIEGKFIIDNEDNHTLADTYCFYEQATGKAENQKQYVQKIKKVTLADIRRVAKKYLTGKGTEVNILQKK